MLQTIVSGLESSGIPFMLTGSMAAAVHGAGRATLDIDLVIEPTVAQLRTFIGSLVSLDLYVSDDAAAEALAHKSMFNVVDAQSGWKADLIMRKSRRFSETEFARRQPMQCEDVSNLLRIARGGIDLAYVRHWVETLQLRTQWEAARASNDEQL